MSQIGSNIYPNTIFPESIQTLPTFKNLSSEDESNYIAYLQAILNGNLSDANYYLSLINPNVLVSANALNILSDTIGAIQDLYGSTSTFSNIVDKKQAEWQEIISKFAYIGEWKKPTIFNNTTTYNKDDLVIYNNKTWQCQQSNVVGDVPQNGDIWTQYYVKNSMVSYRDNDTNRDALYLALQDVNIDATPYKSYTSSSPQWFRLTLIGIIGDNGEGFSFEGKWQSTLSYSYGDLVTYEDICYSSLVNNNLNHVPNSSPTYWKREFSLEIKQIPVQKIMPEGQNIGDLWFEVITV